MEIGKLWRSWSEKERKTGKTEDRYLNWKWAIREKMIRTMHHKATEKAEVSKNLHGNRRILPKIYSKFIWTKKSDYKLKSKVSNRFQKVFIESILVMQLSKCRWKSGKEICIWKRDAHQLFWNSSNQKSNDSISGKSLTFPASILPKPILHFSPRDPTSPPNSKKSMLNDTQPEKNPASLLRLNWSLLKFKAE
jgi:hypothetical protein